MRKVYGKEVDSSMIAPETIRAEIALTHEDVEQKYERYIELQSRATSIGAVRYDKDRVQTSRIYDMTDVIAKAMEAKDAWQTASKYLNELIECFINYVRMAHFNEDTARIWVARYANNWSIGKTAKYLNTTRSHVQYCLGQRAEEQYLKCNYSVA